MKKLLIGLLALTSISTFADPCIIEGIPGAIRATLNCNGKTVPIEVNSDSTGIYQEDTRSAMQNGEFFLLIGRAKRLIINGKLAHESVSPGNFYPTFLIKLDSNLNPVLGTEFSPNAQTIPGGIVSMPTKLVAFGKGVAVLNYFEDLSHKEISIFSAQNLTRFRGLPFKGYIQDNDIWVEQNSLRIKFSIEKSYEENIYFNTINPYGFRYIYSYDLDNHGLGYVSKSPISVF
ncbi:MAG: hypothetical protein ACOYL6_18915 [Bacteriovoracaceae bacterium]